MDDFSIIKGLRSEGLCRRQYEDQLYLTYDYFIREGGMKFGLDRDDSFSAYSDAVIAVIYNIRSGRFEERSSLKTYLRQIYHNKCIDLVRRNANERKNVNHSVNIETLSRVLPDNVKGMIERMMLRSDRELIAIRLREMGEKCREILKLYEEGFSDKQIARHLTYHSADVAKTSRLRCLDKLREKIKQNIKNYETRRRIPG